MKQNWNDVSRLDEVGAGWQHKVLLAALGTTTGALIRAMLAKVDPPAGVAIGRTGDITAEGYVETQVREAGGWSKRVIGTVVAVRDNLRRVADHCRLSDADREALFEEFRKWIRKDYRAESGIEPEKKAASTIWVPGSDITWSPNPTVDGTFTAVDGGSE